MNESRLIDLYPEWMQSGIFTNLQLYDVPWKDANISHNLNIAYYGSHSGDKIISPLVEKFLSADGTLSNESSQKLADMIFTMCGKNWSKLWVTLDLEYNPIENVDAYLTESTDSSGIRDTTDTIKSTGTDTHTASGKDSNTHSGTDIHDSNGSNITANTGTVTNDGASNSSRSQESGIAGFNSSDFSNSDKQTGSENQTVNNTETRNTQDSTQSSEQDKETVNLEDTTTYGRIDTESKDLVDNHTGNEQTSGKESHELHRHGNIGVTTNQQMITAERELWDWYFYERVFKDIDKYLTIAVY